MYNTKLVNNLTKRKLFKTYIFHNNNIEEEYYWDDYDTTYGYKMNTDACCLPKKPVYIAARRYPKITKRPVNLHKDEKVKTLLTWHTYINSKSTQTENPTSDSSTQTFPKLYLPDTRSNYNFEPFKTYLYL